MEPYIPYIMNAIGGLVIGPIVSKVLGGKGGTGAIAGAIGGLAGGYGMGELGLGFQQILSGGALMDHLASFLNGGVGGGIIGGILGLVTKGR